MIRCPPKRLFRALCEAVLPTELGVARRNGFESETHCAIDLERHVCSCSCVTEPIPLITQSSEEPPKRVNSSRALVSIPAIKSNVPDNCAVLPPSSHEMPTITPCGRGNLSMSTMACSPTRCDDRRAATNRHGAARTRERKESVVATPGAPKGEKPAGTRRDRASRVPVVPSSYQELFVIWCIRSVRQKTNKTPTGSCRATRWR